MDKRAIAHVQLERSGIDPVVRGGPCPGTSLESIRNELSRAKQGFQRVSEGVMLARAMLESGKKEALAARGRYLEANGLKETLESAYALLVAVSDSQRQVIRARLEQLVTLALQGVFRNDMRFMLDTQISRGAVSCTPKVGYLNERSKKTIPADYLNEQDFDWYPLDEVGGGVVDVVAFAFRVSILSMYRPKRRQLLIMDEPFKHVSDNYLPNVAEVVRQLAHSCGIQFVIVSHEQELAGAADKVIEIEHGVFNKVLQSRVKT